jgi:hypothetical protein
VPFSNISSAALISRMRSYSLIHVQVTDANMRKADVVYALFCAFKMFKMVECSADREIWSVIRFFECKKCETG